MLFNLDVGNKAQWSQQIRVTGRQFSYHDTVVGLSEKKQFYICHSFKLMIAMRPTARYYLILPGFYKEAFSTLSQF